MVDVTDESENVKHGPFQTCESVKERWGLGPSSVLPLASRGLVQGHAGTAPLPFILQDRLDHLRMGGNVPGSQKGLIHPTKSLVVLCREMFGRGWQKYWAYLEHDNALRNIATSDLPEPFLRG